MPYASESLSHAVCTIHGSPPMLSSTATSAVRSPANFENCWQKATDLSFRARSEEQTKKHEDGQQN
jgi:hypothetical protein